MASNKTLKSHPAARAAGTKNKVRLRYSRTVFLPLSLVLGACGYSAFGWL